MIKRYLLIICLCLLPHLSWSAYQPVAVVELFTSQGCSSCPPADLILAKLDKASQEKHLAILSLSFHVDYWNHLGWRDPFSQKEFTKRQAWYAKQLEDNTYTPQLIINGRYSLVGSDSAKVQKLVNKSLTEPASTAIQLMLVTIDTHDIQVEFKLSGEWREKNLAVALVEKKVAVDVGRGENAGRRLEHVNVVKEFKLLAPDQDTGSFKLKSPSLKTMNQYSIIAYVQERNLPEILGATRIDIPEVE